MNPQAPISPNSTMHQASPAQPAQNVALPPMANSAGQWQQPLSQTVGAPIRPNANANVNALASAASETVNTEEDKVWINKAGEIIHTLQRDPFRESLELGKLKAAYLKARYGKDIKTGDDGRQ